ncbi:hypothetical protein TrCOL_g1240 [Triparma columacea]|uniref:Uncharacterized protein n=1 Tax=Triparma columacea TaxID=722753 RepID=A0A9W7FXI8_9STRA|nr:hypothetical protein TrCOL_g1240 [Triparma columacea]
MDQKTPLPIPDVEDSCLTTSTTPTSSHSPSNSPLTPPSSSDSSSHSSAPSFVLGKRDGETVYDLEGNFKELKRLKVLDDKGMGDERLQGVEVIISHGSGDDSSAILVKDPTVNLHRQILGVKNVLEVQREVERRMREIRKLEDILDREETAGYTR